MKMQPKLPDWLKEFMGPFGPAMVDECSGVTISYGFPVTRYMGEDVFTTAKHAYKAMRYDRAADQWYFVTSELTPADAIRQYGEVTDLEIGPRKGFKSVTYGTTKFTSRELDPRQGPKVPLTRFDWEEIQEVPVKPDFDSMTLAEIRAYLSNELSNELAKNDNRNVGQRLVTLATAVTNTINLTTLIGEL